MVAPMSISHKFAQRLTFQPRFMPWGGHSGGGLFMGFIPGRNATTIINNYNGGYGYMGGMYNFDNYMPPRPRTGFERFLDGAGRFLLGTLPMLFSGILGFIIGKKAGAGNNGNNTSNANGAGNTSNANGTNNNNNANGVGNNGNNTSNADGAGNTGDVNGGDSTSAIIHSNTETEPTVTFNITRGSGNETTGWDRILGSFTVNGNELDETQKRTLMNYLRESYLNDKSGNTFFTGQAVFPKNGITINGETFVPDTNRYDVNNAGKLWNWSNYDSASGISSAKGEYQAKEITTYTAIITTTKADGKTSTEEVTIDNAASEQDAKEKLARSRNIDINNITFDANTNTLIANN